MSVRPFAPGGGGKGRLRSVVWRCAPLVIGLQAALITGVGGGAAASTLISSPPGVSAATLSREVEFSLVDTTTFAEPAGTQILGTGIIVSATGLVLTAYHVVRDAVFVGVTVGGQGGVYPASVVVTNPDDDLALLRIEADPPLTPARLGGSASAQVGDPVVAMGNARGLGLAPTAATGRLVALDRSIRYGVGSNVVSLADVMEATAPIFAGDSGGPLVDAAGRVIGVIAAGSGDSPCPPRQDCPLHVTFAIPIDQALSEVGYTVGS